MVLSVGNEFLTRLLSYLIPIILSDFLIFDVNVLISGFHLLSKFLFTFFDSGDSVHQKGNKSNPTAEHSDFL